MHESLSPDSIGIESLPAVLMPLGAGRFESLKSSKGLKSLRLQMVQMVLNMLVRLFVFTDSVRIGYRKIEFWVGIWRLEPGT